MPRSICLHTEAERSPLRTSRPRNLDNEQSVMAALEARLCPKGQGWVVGEGEPAGQYDWALHGPVQLLLVSNCVAP